MFETLKKAFKVKEIRGKIFFTLLIILVYRIGCYIPVPGIGGGLISQADLSNVSYLNIMSMMTGGALSNGTWFAMGIGPYINASIIIQLLSVAIPALERLTRMGEEGQKKIAKYTRLGAVILAVVQSIGILVNYAPALLADPTSSASNAVKFLFNQRWLFYTLCVIFYASGALATVWLGERITDYGVSNGISLLIFVGVLSTAGQAVLSMITNTFTGGGNLVYFWKLIGYILVIIVVFAGIVFVDLAERKVPVQYAKRVQGRKMYGGQTTVIPMKINASGVMPLIFSFSILSFPEMIATMFWPNSKFVIWWQRWMGTNSWLYMVVLCLLILGFAYFYASIQFKPEEISRSIQQNGGNIVGIRPGKPTTEYLTRIHRRITLFGAIFLAITALIPAFLFRLIDAGNSSIFSATGLLICVSIALEFNNALESQIMMKQYKGFLK